jgi:hypothetical protein
LVKTRNIVTWVTCHYVKLHAQVIQTAKPNTAMQMMIRSAMMLGCFMLHLWLWR